MNRPLLTLTACVTLALAAGGYVYMTRTPAPEGPAAAVSGSPAPVITAAPEEQLSPVYQAYIDEARRAGAQRLSGDCSDLFTNELTQRLWQNTPALAEACLRLAAGATPDRLRAAVQTGGTVTAQGVSGNAAFVVLAVPEFKDQALLLMVEDAGRAAPVMGLALIKSSPAALALKVGLPFPEPRAAQAATEKVAPEQPADAGGFGAQESGAVPEALNADRLKAFCGEYNCVTVNNGAGPYALSFVSPGGVRGAITADPDGAVLYLFGVSDVRTQQAVVRAFDRSVSGDSDLMNLYDQCAPSGEARAQVQGQTFAVMCASGLLGTPPALPGAQAPWVEYGVRVTD
ncbi:hypothetical protein [Deinococcus soli (ex Cha et al. 2016)]|uniref:Uncharacterized protein n=2 Tax=Deinococcus soli (ex Cha et al. 2016) TaxID=1309411 RepID=A0AAE3XCH8_9DEIO|nr:hypothetical protein [Deinococcus soli (ex Cha et al. 2016)]MDR6218139.1 hypothetical protein [Deinococcus soli (ex Cha et al. 2016)]MDR6328879.1 hypothetical protein [Deinococcus soli (ex Cha et al. 2016)]MDR6751633.1 hypothetical protein [Deinococcus soli (ex Cha et al. 2016)]